MEQKWLRKPTMGLYTLRHGIQSSMEAILACHPALSTKWLDWVAILCESWRIRTDPILQKHHKATSDFKTVTEKLTVTYPRISIDQPSAIHNLQVKRKRTKKCLHLRTKRKKSQSLLWISKTLKEQDSYLTVQVLFWERKGVKWRREDEFSKPRYQREWRRRVTTVPETVLNTSES